MPRAPLFTKTARTPRNRKDGEEEQCTGKPFAHHTSQAALYMVLYMYIYFYPRTLSALPHDCLPTLEPGTRSRISARFMAPGHETPRARRGGTARAGGHSPRPSGDLCAEPLRLEDSPDARGVPSSRAGPSQNGTCSGGGIGRKIRAGRSAVNYFRFGRTRVCITPVSGRMGSFGTEPQQVVVSWFCLSLIARSCVGFGVG